MSILTTLLGEVCVLSTRLISSSKGTELLSLYTILPSFIEIGQELFEIIERHTHRQTDRHTHTHRQTDTHTHTDTLRHIHTRGLQCGELSRSQKDTPAAQRHTGYLVFVSYTPKKQIHVAHVLLAENIGALWCTLKCR